VSDYREKEFNPFKRDICVSNPIIHGKILEALKRGKSGFSFQGGAACS
jgi:hypothetical protein